ncbi:hypothetical protein O3G_MSEX013647, partial [Manduca sexta]
MDGATMNHYEKQLYTVFKTFDVDNAEALDRSAVHALCNSLQLEDRGAALVDTLFERRADRVTFTQFRNGLLAVLGADPVAPRAAPPAQQPPDPPPSDEDSSGCEVAPQIVFGSKKYGRRSRPQRSSEASPGPRAASASRLDTDDHPQRNRNGFGRSASAMEARDVDREAGTAPSEPPALDPARRIDRDQALALCRGLSMDGVDGLVDRIFEEASSSDTTVGEFFGQLNSALATTIEAARDGTVGGDVEDDENGSGAPAELVAEAWERAGVPRGRALLHELGFDDTTLRPAELERALDDELLALPAAAPERALLLLAALEVARLRACLARRRADAATAERDKLRADVAEANARARLLAQEVDESHARLETELKASLRRAELRHAEATRAAAAEAAAERERAAAVAARLDTELARRLEIETRLKGEANELRNRLEEMEGRAQATEERLAVVERERARLATEARAARREGEGAEEGARRTGGELTARLSELQLENKLLRDRNDELCAALEASERRAGTAGGGEGSPGRAAGDLSAELGSLLAPHRAEECDSSPVSLDQKVLGHVEAVTKLREMLDEVQRLPASACDACAALRERMQHLSDALIVPDPPADTEDDAEQRHRQEKQRLETLVKELETSLEQMKSEYDRCEEYWSNKLEEERSIYSEEQRAGDERLADLVSKIHEYERQFAGAAALPTIDERHSLEAQVTDLEEEFSQYKRMKEAELAERDRELERLRDRLDAADKRRAAAPPPAHAPAP